MLLCFAASPSPSLLIVIVPPTNMYASLQSHKFDLIIEVWNLIWLMSLYVPRNPSFFSTPFLILNLDALFYVLSNKFIIFIYSITIYYYYINLRWSIIFCLYSGDIYLPLNISPSFVSGLFFCDVFETLVILSTILFPIKSPVGSVAF